MPHFGYVDSYDKNAPLPRIGTKWIWEIDSDEARSLMEVTAIKWNGEEWWIQTQQILADRFSEIGTRNWNDVGRFWEAVTVVNGAITGQVVMRRPEVTHHPTQLFAND
jgi:hypothetical protein